ncbi:hypothetical protein D3C72_1872540 [compost metagenome]
MRQARFHGCVGRVERRAHQRNARGHVHHHGITAGPQGRDRGAGQQDRRKQVHVHHLLDVGLCRIFQAAGAHAPGVVDQDVEATQGSHGLVQRDKPSFSRAHIGANPRGGIQTAQRVIQHALPTPRDNHPGAARRQRMGQRKADAA